MKIINARIIDGTGREPYLGTVVINGERIAAVEPAAAGSVTGEATDAEVIDAGGRIVCPGFIDAHSHADNAPLLAEDDLSKISQGVTTEIVGNCGSSLAPIRAGDDAFAEGPGRLFGLEPDQLGGWHSSTEWFAAVDAAGTVTNVCHLVGHGTLRQAVIGPTAAAPSAEDLAAMGRLLDEALDAGAFGLSTGLVYPPGRYADTEEVIALARRLPAGRVYASHIRNESAGLLDAIDEALRIGREAGCRVQVSHLKASGRANWGAVGPALERLDAARAEGLPVTQDVYPYVASSTGLTSTLAGWLLDAGPAEALRRLRDPAVLDRLRAEADPHYERIMISSTRSHAYEGRRVPELATELGLDPFETVVRILLEEELHVTTVLFTMCEEDVVTVLRSPHSAIGSDGLPPGLGGTPHPRLYGTFPRVLGEYVRRRKIIGLAEAVRRMTSLPASIFGVPDRGTIAAGAVADLVCFDPDTVDHDGSFTDPAVPPVGIDCVLQAGRVVITDGVWGGTRRGRRLVPA
ncbi:N-acyl-D-amino-acid deacylase family protein [Microlunatus speluncae]|uniref:N-acyl-D-amino-acid deacylase family protein n=1 Tax=Microlunatus speluncae TaxID=2594267 RepID=UPI0012666A59|nr:D-aminoacylase [Microlunatus speluncae]